MATTLKPRAKAKPRTTRPPKPAAIVPPVAEPEAPVMSEITTEQPRVEAQIPQASGLSNEYRPQSVTAPKTLPGYHASLWPRNDFGIGCMEMYDITVYSTTDPAIADAIPPVERLKFTRTPEGALTRGNQIVGIETLAHYEARQDAARQHCDSVRASIVNDEEGEPTYIPGGIRRIDGKRTKPKF